MDLSQTYEFIKKDELDELIDNKINTCIENKVEKIIKKEVDELIGNKLDNCIDNNVEKIIKKEVDDSIDKHDKVLYTICALTLIISIRAFYR